MWSPLPLPPGKLDFIKMASYLVWSRPENSWIHSDGPTSSPSGAKKYSIVIITTAFPTMGDHWSGWVLDAMAWWERLEWSSDCNAIWMTFMLCHSSLRSNIYTGMIWDLVMKTRLISGHHCIQATLRLLQTPSPVFLDPVIFPAVIKNGLQDLKATLWGIDPKDFEKTEVSDTRRLGDETAIRTRIASRR